MNSMKGVVIKMIEVGDTITFCQRFWGRIKGAKVMFIDEEGVDYLGKKILVKYKDPVGRIRLSLIHPMQIPGYEEPEKSERDCLEKVIEEIDDEIESSDLLGKIEQNIPDHVGSRYWQGYVDAMRGLKRKLKDKIGNEKKGE